MDFELSEEHRMIQDMAYKFAVNEMAPVAQQYDREEKYPREIWKKGCEAGLVGAFIPEEYGGPGFGFFEQALISEQFARIDLGMCLCVGACTFGSEHILFYGSEEQKKKWLPAVVNGEAISAGAFTEPVAKHHPAHAPKSTPSTLKAVGDIMARDMSLSIWNAKMVMRKNRSRNRKRSQNAALFVVMSNGPNGGDVKKKKSYRSRKKT